MNQKLLPRLTAEQAVKRLKTLNELMTSHSNAELASLDDHPALANPVGGPAATTQDLKGWQAQLLERMSGYRTGSTISNNQHSLELGRALAEIINPVPADAAHDGVWSFISLHMLPELMLARWPLTSDGTTTLAVDRWIGNQAGRDRNYMKLAWRRWRILGPVMLKASPPLGEDEFGGLLERTAVARNARLVQFAAETVVSFDTTQMGRMTFTRELMKHVCYATGARVLDCLDDDELMSVVRGAAHRVMLAGLRPS